MTNINMFPTTQEIIRQFTDTYTLRNVSKVTNVNAETLYYMCRATKRKCVRNILM